MKTALILIDIQNDYFPGGKMELEGVTEAGEKAGILLNAARDAGAVICHIRHLSTQPGAGFFVPETTGAEINSSVAPLPGERVIEKNFPNAFRGTELEEFLQAEGVGKIIFAGMMTHMCVDTTVRAGFDMGYKCALAFDACATRELEFNGTTVKASDVQASFIAALDGLFALALPSDELAKSFAQC